MRVAIIPARASSKRIPRKNIKPFSGRPIIAWSILAAQESGCFDQILVSTDDDEIAHVATEYGASAPFRRPKSLADDHTPTVPVIAHAVQWLADHGTPAEDVCCLYATAPFVQANDLVRGLEALHDSDAAYAFPVTSFPFPIQRAVRLRADKRVEMFYPEHGQTRSQDLPEAYHDAGQFYWGQARAWVEGIPIIGPNSTSIVLPRYRVQDIDTPEDWDRAERLFQVLQAEK